MLYILATLGSSMSVPSARQATSGIRLVATNQYRQNPIRRQISSYGAPVSAPNDYGSPVAEVVDVRCKADWSPHSTLLITFLFLSAGPSCQTVYEDVCETVEDEECNTVNDEICEVNNEEQCQTVQDRRCSVSFSKTCSPGQEKKCDQVVDTINEQTCTSRSERKCATVSHPACHVMKVGQASFSQPQPHLRLFIGGEMPDCH